VQVNDGSLWKSKVNCTDPDGDTVKITDDTGLIDTDKSGNIYAIPEIPGKYNITFICKDDNYNEAKKTFLFEVLE